MNYLNFEINEEIQEAIKNNKPIVALESTLISHGLPYPKNLKVAKSIGKLISTKYYIAEYSKDIIGVEVCSAIKNIYSMIIGAGQSLNSSSNLFQKSLIEMKFLIKYFKD